MAKNVIIGILSLLVVALVADSVWLHINCCRQQENIAALAHAGDFQFMDGKLVLNDKTPTAPDTGEFAMGSAQVTNYSFGQTGTPDWTPISKQAMVLKNTFRRNCDYTLPVVISHDMENYEDNDTYNTWSTAGYNGYSNCRTLHLADTASTLEEAITHSGSTSTLASPGALKSVLSDILRILGSLRLVYMHIGNAGMVIGVDGSKTSSGIARRTDPSAQPDSP